MSIKGNNEPPAQYHQCSCLVLSRHLSNLYRPLGHFDNITVLSVALELQHISYVIMIGLLILVQSAISLGQVLLIMYPLSSDIPCIMPCASKPGFLLAHVLSNH